MCFAQCVGIVTLFTDLVMTLAPSASVTLLSLLLWKLIYDCDLCLL